MDKPNEILAVNLRKYLKSINLTANAIGVSGKASQKTVWTAMTGTVAPSINTATKVCSAIDLDLGMLCRMEFSPEQIGRSKRVGMLADKLMQLRPDQIKLLDEAVTGMSNATGPNPVA
jgi:hypothetical protein